MEDMEVTIIVPVHNEARYIADCIISILNQTIHNWKLIIVDDHSTDNTAEIVAKFKDERITYRRNSINLGSAYARNKAIEMAQSEYIFFIDGDCIAAENWLEEGLRLFKSGDYAAIEGKLYFVSQEYQPVYSDRVVENLNGGQYMTANMAYRRSKLLEAGLFDPALRRYHDRDIALRVKQHGEIIFAPSMIVFHRHVKWTPKTYFNYATNACYTVLLFKRCNKEQEGHNIFHRIYAPEKLLTIVFPPLVLAALFLYRFKTLEDYILFFLIYPRLICERVLLWKACIKERIFLV